METESDKNEDVSQKRSHLYPLYFYEKTSNSRNDYLKTLRESYLSTNSKKERGKLLDEAEKMKPR